MRTSNAFILFSVIALLIVPAMLCAQSDKPEVPPIQQPLVREGDLAVRLVAALGLSTTSDETEAESALGSANITPGNGWIADYPATPDVLNEIRDSIIAAADAGSIEMGADEALDAFQNVKADLGLEIRHYAEGEPHELNPPAYDSTSVNDYYYDQGPPIVTYYAPPPDYYYLYTWVPYPFWWYNFWFPGYFILNDFHRVIVVHHRTAFISNHFNDFRHHRVYRIDPADRFRGRTYAGIGAPKGRRFLSTGVNRGPEAVFNRNRTSPPSGTRTFSRPPVRRSTPSGEKTMVPRSGRTLAPSSGQRSVMPSGGRTFAPPSGGRSVSSPHVERSGIPSGGRTFSAPAGGRTAPPPSGGRPGSPVGGPRR